MSQVHMIFITRAAAHRISTARPAPSARHGMYVRSTEFSLTEVVMPPPATSGHQ